MKLEQNPMLVSKELEDEKSWALTCSSNAPTQPDVVAKK